MTHEAHEMIDGWTSPPAFKAVQNWTLALGLGESQFKIGSMQFHIHHIRGANTPHAHSEYQILYYRKGRGQQIMDDRRNNVGPQTVFFIPPHCLHHFVPAANTVAEVFALRFVLDLRNEQADFDEADRDLHRLAKLLYSQRLRRIELSPGEIREAEDLMEQLQQELTVKPFGYAMAATGFLLLQLRLFLRAGIREEDMEKPMTRAQFVFLRATGLIRLRLAEPLTLTGIAADCHVSSSYLQKIFRQTLAKSFSRYVQEVKIDHAAHLLRTTDMPVKQVAAACGIPDRNYFTRLFRKILGTNPRAFRTT